MLCGVSVSTTPPKTGSYYLTIPFPFPLWADLDTYAGLELDSGWKVEITASLFGLPAVVLTAFYALRQLFCASDEGSYFLFFIFLACALHPGDSYPL